MQAQVEEGCIGCGLCENTCPAVFKVQDGVAVPIVDEIPEEELPAASAARDGCPVGVIVLLAE